jgi:hypothetical protein
LNKLVKKPRGLLTLKLGFDEQTSYEREREREKEIEIFRRRGWGAHLWWWSFVLMWKIGSEQFFFLKKKVA